MSRQQFFLMLLINGIVVAAYLVFCLIRYASLSTKREPLMWFRAIVMLLCPVVGACFFGIGYVLRRTVFSEPVDLEDVIFSKERVKTYSFATEEERDYVPLEDAMLVSDTHSLRSLMMNVVRNDISDSLATISHVLNSEDSETSHYAASVLQESLDDFRANVQRLRQAVFDDGEHNVETALQLASYMNPILRQQVFTELEQKSMVAVLDEVLESAYEHGRLQMKNRHFEMAAMRLLEVENFARCEEWCTRMDYFFPDELPSYTCKLKLYFNMGDKERFFNVLKKLRESDIIVDNETLELIRAFL